MVQKKKTNSMCLYIPRTMCFFSGDYPRVCSKNNTTLFGNTFATQNLFSCSIASIDFLATLKRENKRSEEFDPRSRISSCKNIRAFLLITNTYIVWAQIFLARAQNCEKRLLGFVMSVCLSVCPVACVSVRPHGTIRLPLDRIS
jgi:hypothetical protein